MSRRRWVMASASVGLMALVSGAALVAAPGGLVWWLAVFALAGVALSVPAALSEPRDLTPALLLGLAPVIGLLADEATTWLVAPLAALALAAAELNALSWTCDGAHEDADVVSRRLGKIGQLALLGLAASWGILAAESMEWLNGTLAVLVAAAAVAGVGYVVFRPSAAGSAEPSSLSPETIRRTRPPTPTPPAGARPHRST